MATYVNPAESGKSRSSVRWVWPVLSQVFKKVWIFVFMAAMAAMTTAAGIYWLLGKVPKYEASLTIVPVSSDFTPQQPNSGGGLGIIFEALGEQPVTPFDIFLSVMHSERLAVHLHDRLGLFHEYLSYGRDGNKLVKEPFDEEMLKRGYPFGLDGLYRWFGFPERSDANISDFSGHLASKIVVSTEGGVTRLTYRHGDPEFAVRLLTNAYDGAIELMRRDTETETQKHIDYLYRQLDVTQLEVNRAFLTNMLAHQEQTMMLVKTGAPFVVDLIDGPSISNGPVEPKLFLLLILFPVTGVILTVGIIAAWIVFKSVKSELETSRT